MGLDYSFHYIAPRVSVDVLLEALAARVSSPYARSLRAVLPWVPADESKGTGIRGWRAPCHGTAGYYAVVLLLPLCREVDRYLRECGVEPESHTERGLAEVGMIDLQIEAGLSLVHLWLTTATSHQTNLFLEPSVQEVMTSLARDGKARAAFMDTEDEGMWDRIFPPRRGMLRFQPVARPAKRGRLTPGQRDSFYRKALRVAGLR